MQDEFTTPAAEKLLAAEEPGERPSGDICDFYSPDQSEHVACTQDELEDYERENEVALTEDVISDHRDYDEFVRYLSENCDLKRSN